MANFRTDSPLHWAAEFNIREVNVELLQHGADVNAVDRNGNTPLHWAAMHNSKENITDLLRRGAGINAVNKCGNTPLHTAAEYYRKDIAVELIQCGADVNAANKNGTTPLHWAAEQNSKEIVTELLQHEADTNTVNWNGDTPLHWAASNNNKAIVAELIQLGANVNAVNKNGDTPLQCAARNNNKETATELIQLGADVNTVNKNGATILHIICTSGADELQSVIDDLLKAHMNINCINSAKETPLHLVCKGISNISGNKEDIANTMLFWMATRLLAHAADPSLKDSHGTSCYDIAESLPKLLDLLKKPINITAIPLLLKWSDPKSEVHRSKIAQVVRNQKSTQTECYHYHKEPIGLGAFGNVYAGVNEKTGREVAVKRMEKDKLSHSEDEQEITSLVKLRNCDEVVKYLDHYEDTNFIYLILDLMEGTLKEYLDKTPRDRSLDVTLSRDLINGLQFLHESKVLHRDIKPGNILYKVSPRVCLKLADFGLSTKDIATAQSLSAAGTRCWMAPELLQVTGRIKHSEESDVFACGLVLHFLLAEKRHPFTQPSNIFEQNETERNIIQYKLFLHNNLSAEARDLLETMLVKDKKKRPKTYNVLSHPFCWSKAKTIQFVIAVGNQPEVEMPRHKVTTLSPVELQLENTLGNDFAVIGWQNSISTVYTEMTGSGRRKYNTSSAVELVRFVRNCYAHVSDRTRTVSFQKDVIRDCELFNKFPSLVMEVYKAVMIHGWDKARIEIESALEME